MITTDAPLTAHDPSANVASMSDCPSAASDRFASPTPSWSAVGRLIRLRSQTGTWLLLLPTMWSLVLAAEGIPPLRLVLTFAIGSFLMRSTGVVLNDLADRSFDRCVARTQTRPLASGELSPKHAGAVAAVLLGLAGLLVTTLNSLTLLLSPIALLFAALYPFAKRVVHIPQAMLGIAFGWGTIMAWAASRGAVETPAWLLFFATVCWAVGYDTIYALQDQEDDRRIGVKSSALFFGAWTWIVVGAALTVMLLFLGLAGWMMKIGWIYDVILGATALLCLMQAIELRKPITTTRAFQLFHQHVWLGSGILAGMIAGFLL